MGRGGRRWWWIGAITIALVGCSTGSASYDDALTVAAPGFAATPDTPAESPQLDALVVRDTDGLGVSGPSADPSLITRAFAELEAAFPGTERISDLYFDDENVWFTIVDPESPNRQRSVYWSEYSGLSVGDAQFMEDDTTFPITAVRVEAITALVDGLTDRYPTLLVDMPRLSTELSYDLGLSWRMDLVDARGDLAIVFADLDGTVTVIDQALD